MGHGRNEPTEGEVVRSGFTLIELLVVIAMIGVLDRSALAGGTVGPGGRTSGAVRQQPEAAWRGPGQLRGGARGLSHRPTSAIPGPRDEPSA